MAQVFQPLPINKGYNTPLHHNNFNPEAIRQKMYGLYKVRVHVITWNILGEDNGMKQQNRSQIPTFQ